MKIVTALLALHFIWHIVIGVLGLMHGGVWGILIAFLSLILFFKCKNKKCKECEVDSYE